mgnify:FL=1
MKLSPAQQLIIDKMKEGWQLESSVGADPRRPWLSRVVNDKLETIWVNFASVHKLYELGLINFTPAYPISRWRLKEPKRT